MAAKAIYLTLPVGRIVQGDIYNGKDTKQNGEKKFYKKGPQAGQPLVTWFFAYAIPKFGEQHWSQSPWGKMIWDHGHAESKGLAQRKDFAWKILDGDSTEMMQNNKRACDNPDFRGNWVLRLQGNRPAKLYSITNGVLGALTEPGYIKAGYFVEANIEIKFNEESEKPGVYLDPKMVCFRAFGQVIEFGPDPQAAGFGGGALPAGSSATPPAGLMPATPGAPAAAPAYMPPTAAPVATLAPVAVVPNVAFVQQAAGQVAAPPAPPAPVRQMTAAAGGATYEQYIGAGWTDAQLVAGGLMLP